MANHEQVFGAAKWIAAPDGITAPNIRATFAAPAVRQATITICGLGYFLLYLNGERVSKDLFVPVTSDYIARDIIEYDHPFDEEMGHRCYYLTYDVTDFLRRGDNELAVALGAGMFAQPIGSFHTAVRFGQERLCYRIDWVDENGNAGVCFSGTDARWHESIVAEYDLFKGEKQDLRRCPADWTTAAYADWHEVIVLPELDTELCLQDCPADRIIRQITPRKVGESDLGTVWDAGENISGWVVLADESAAGEEVHVRLSEALTPEGTLDVRYMHWQHLDVISDGAGRDLHLEHTWHGFRYFTVQGKARVKSVAVIHTDTPVTSAFKCASPVLNWLYEAYVRTQLCNMHGGIPSDCPHLERRGYTGDGQWTMETALLTLDHQEFVRKWMRDIKDCQDIHTGHVQYTAPYTHCGGGPGGWGCAIAVVPWEYYRQYGDLAPLADMHENICKYVGYMRAHSEGDLVTSDRPGLWCLGDWCPPGSENPDRMPPKIPEPYVNTYFLIKTLDILRKAEKLLGKPVDPQWAQIREKCVAAILGKYYDEATGDFCGNVEGANAFALDMGLGDERTLANMIAHYRATGCYDTGIFGTTIVTKQLIENGQTALAFDMLAGESPISFAKEMEKGATTLWEYWPVGYSRSLSHPMFGAVVKVLFHDVLGIRQEADSAAWQHVVINPRMTLQVPSAEGSIRTPLGEVKVAYQLWDGRLEIAVNVPAGMDAKLLWAGERIPLEAGENRFELC